MKQIVDLFAQFEGEDLPFLQKEILKTNSLDFLITHKALAAVLNPTFSAHYCIDRITAAGDVITTRDTTGYMENWGNQSRAAELNAYDLSSDLKQLLVQLGAYRVGKKYFIDINQQQYRIPGMTTGNTIA